MVPYTLALLCSAIGRFLGLWYFTYQRSSYGAVDRADDIFALWQLIVGFPSLGPPYIQAIAFYGCCSDGAVLAPLWTVVSYTLSVAVSAGVSPAVALFNSAILADRLSPQLFFKWVTLRPQSSTTLLFEKSQVTKNRNTTISSTPSSSETFDQSFHPCNDGAPFPLGSPLL